MKTYELTYIITPEMVLEEAETKAKEIESGIQSKEGIILSQTNPYAKTLAYPINNKASGFLGVLEFQLEPEKLCEFKETLLKDEKIVRHMLAIKKPSRAIKEKRTRIKSSAEQISTHLSSKTTKDNGKVELKDIEQKLDEILGE